MVAVGYSIVTALLLHVYCRLLDCYCMVTVGYWIVTAWLLYVAGLLLHYYCKRT